MNKVNKVSAKKNLNNSSINNTISYYKKSKKKQKLISVIYVGMYCH